MSGDQHCRDLVHHEDVGDDRSVGGDDCCDILVGWRRVSELDV